MKTVIIKRMSLHYFKGIRSLDIEFGRRETNISGPNGSGKSTIADAFYWCLWGKNAAGQSDTKFLIKTVDKDGVEIPHVNHSVTVEMEVDGVAHTFERTLVPEYSQEDELKGNHTDYMWNRVPVKKKEYDEKVSAIVSETLFRTVTSPFAFLSLDWQKQREMLMRLAGDISDSEVVAAGKGLDEVLGMLTGKTIEELKRQLDAEIRRVNEQMSGIPDRIDEAHRMMPQEPDMDRIATQRHELEERLEAIEKTERDEAAAISAAAKERNDLLREKTEIEWKRTQLLNQAQSEERKAIHAANSTYTEAEQQAATVWAQMASADSARKAREAQLRENADTCRLTIDKFEAELASLRDEWTKEQGKAFTAEEYLKCPLYGHICGDGQACSRYDQDQQGAFDRFQAGKAERISAINAKGRTLAEEVRRMKADLAKREQEYIKAVEDGKVQAEALDREYQEARARMEANPKRPLISTIKGEDLPEWVELGRQAGDIQRRIDAMEQTGTASVRTDHMAEKYEIRKGLEELARQADAARQIKAFEDRIEELEAKLKALGNEKSSLEYRRSLVNEFELTKCGMVTERVNRMFKLVSWQMFQRQLNGDEVPTCICLVGGVKWSDANTAGRINAGIDVASTLARAYGLTAPMFIDNAESVGYLYDSGAFQRIILRFTKGSSGIKVDKTD